MDIAKLKKVFPSYMDHIILPECAREQEIIVYRACKTRKIERESFLPTYEENGFKITAGGSPDDPQEYCLSTFEKPQHLKRFVAINGKYTPPWVLAKGTTSPSCGIACRTKDWKKKRTSHVDWWLYEGAEPWTFFYEVDYDEERRNDIQNR